MLIRVDTASSVPLAVQIAAQIRGGVATGDIAPGERLPSARDLGDALGVNLHTVLRAYGVLRDEGLLELRRGRGAVVSSTAEPSRVRLEVLARELVRHGERMGLDADDIAEMVRRST